MHTLFESAGGPPLADRVVGYFNTSQEEWAGFDWVRVQYIRSA